MLRRLNSGTPRAVRVASNNVADMIVRKAKPRVPLGPGKNGHARDTIRKIASGKEVRVVEGGSRFPYMPWLDFGGSVNKHTSKPTRRRFIREGRYIWHVLAQNQGDINDYMADALRGVVRESGLDVD